MTDILEQAREIVAKATHCDDILRCASVEFPCPCRGAASAILALAEPKWREINDEAKNGNWVFLYRPIAESGTWDRIVIGRFDAEIGDFIWPSEIHDIFDDEQELDDFYEGQNSFTHWKPLPLPPKEEQ